MGLIKVPEEIELKDIFVDVYCVGNNPQGEGLLLVIKKNNYIIYSALIDGNFDMEFIKNCGIEYFDFICWTHPHQDHSINLEKLIQQYSNNNTKITVPTMLFDFYKSMTYDCQKLSDYLRNINVRNKTINGEYVEAHNYVSISEEYVDKSGNKLLIKVQALSPISSRINNNRNNECCNLNELSICLLITINDISLLFTSDIINYVINEMHISKDLFSNTVYYKIPHHGSIDSNKILDFMPDYDHNSIAVSTIYKNNGYDKTPNQDLLNDYINKGLLVYCTSESYLKKINNSNNFGIIATRIKIKNDGREDSIEWDIDLKGEAIEVRKSNNDMMFTNTSN